MYLLQIDVAKWHRLGNGGERNRKIINLNIIFIFLYKTFFAFSILNFSLPVADWLEVFETLSFL